MNPSPGSSLALPISLRFDRQDSFTFTNGFRPDFESARRAQYTSRSRPILSRSGIAAQSRSSAVSLAKRTLRPVIDLSRRALHVQVLGDRSRHHRDCRSRCHRALSCASRAVVAPTKDLAPVVSGKTPHPRHVQPASEARLAPKGVRTSVFGAHRFRGSCRGPRLQPRRARHRQCHHPYFRHWCGRILSAPLATRPARAPGKRLAERHLAESAGIAAEPALDFPARRPRKPSPGSQTRVDSTDAMLVDSAWSST